MKILKPHSDSQAAVGKKSERSFTLIETIIALGLMTFLVLEVASVQGNAIYFSEYGRNATTASWLAQRIMSQVEYNSGVRDFKDMELMGNVKEQPFEDFPDFKFSIETKEWKLPLIDLLAGGDEEEGSSKRKRPSNPLIKAAIGQVLGSDILKTVAVEVSWAEGARRNSVKLAYLLTNQKKIDDAIGSLKALLQQTPGGGVPPAGGVPNPGGASPVPTPPPTPPI